MKQFLKELVQVWKLMPVRIKIAILLMLPGTISLTILIVSHITNAYVWIPLICVLFIAGVGIIMDELQ